MTDISLLIGLGNPGARYASNRHNFGFMAIAAIANRYRFGSESQKYGGLFCDGAVSASRVFLFKPMGFMNLSGQAAGELARFYKIPPERITVFHDELDLPLGKLRVKRGGGHGGHNGLKSLDAHLGQEYGRVRLGIGHPGERDLVSPYVLSDFMKEEMPAVEKLLDAVARELPLLLMSDEAAFMSKVSLG